MAETLVDLNGQATWTWENVMNDLKDQGGLGDVVIDPLSVNAHGCGGVYKGNHFYITWLPNKFLLVSMQEFSQELVGAFSKVVEYEPFARYELNGLVTVEWDKVDPRERFNDLTRARVRNLQSLTK